MGYEVVVTDVVARPTAVVVATTRWEEVSTLWRTLLDEVWRCLRAGGVDRGCPNIMLYWDDGPLVHFEVGVELRVPCPLTGRVMASSLPAGRAAMATHRGSYAGLAEAHLAVRDWCAARGQRLVGTRWEIYGPHSDDPADVWTEIYYLLT
jgi:effector-binding domain-containing protein